MDKDSKISDDGIQLLEPQINMFHKLFLLQSKNIADDFMKNLIRDILQKQNAENGKVYGALVYAWLKKHFIRYTPQVYMDKEKCFKSSE